jgi:hypothetical protein
MVESSRRFWYEVTRYCESRDGIVWTKPKLGLVEIDGNSDNTVILQEPWVCHNFSPFLESRPGTRPQERFKALAGVHKGRVLEDSIEIHTVELAKYNGGPSDVGSASVLDRTS